MTTGLAGGLTQPYKGTVPAALKRSEDLTTAPISHGSPFKGAQTVDKAHVLQVKTWAFSMQWIRKLKQKTLASLFIF